MNCNSGWICNLELDKVGKHKYLKDTASSLLSQVLYHATMGMRVLVFSFYEVLHVELLLELPLRPTFFCKVGVFLFLVMIEKVCLNSSVGLLIPRS